MTDQEMMQALIKIDPYYRELFDEGGWEPLTDPGDALRLGVWAGVVVNGLFAKHIKMDEYENGSYEAVCRAIVRAVIEQGPL